MSVSIVKGGETLINTAQVELFLVRSYLMENHLLRAAKQKATVGLTGFDVIEIHTAADLCSVSRCAVPLNDMVPGCQLFVNERGNFLTENVVDLDRHIAL